MYRGEYPEQVPPKLAVALSFPDRTWETPGADCWLCPLVHALRHHLPRPMFACGILGTWAPSLCFCYITASLPSVGSALQRDGAEVGAWRKASSPDRRLTQSTVSASPLPPQHAQGGNCTSNGIQCIFSARSSGPVLVPHEHSTCQWPHVRQSPPELAGPGGTPHRVSLCTLALPQAQDRIKGRPLLGPSLVWRCLSCHCACGCLHPWGTWVASQCKPPPFLPVFFSGQGRECSSRDLRTSGMSMAGATPIWSQLDMAGGACSGSLEAAEEAGTGWEVASSGGGRGGSPRQPMGSMDPSPPVHPQLGHLPAPAAARPSFLLPGRAGLAPCQQQHVEPLRQSSDREPGLLSNFAKGSSPPGWEP